MTAINRTIYPRFKTRISDHELQEAYTPTPDDSVFVVTSTRTIQHRFLLMVQLKVFQCLGHFPPFHTIPANILVHIRTQMGLPDTIPAAYPSAITMYRHRVLIRDYLGVRRADRTVRRLALQAVMDAALVKDYPADLINVAIESLIRQSCEFPPFITLDRLVRHGRALVNRQLYEQVQERIPETVQHRLEHLLLREPSQGQSSYQNLKHTPKRATLTHLKETLDYYDWLMSLGDPAPWVQDLSQAKITLFAAQARALDASEMKALMPAKRMTLLVCFISRVQAQTCDHLIEMFVKRLSKLHQAAQRALQRFREQSQETTDDLIALLAEIVHAADDQPAELTFGQRVQRILGSPEQMRTVLNRCETVMAYRNKNYYSLVAGGLSSHRKTLFRLVRTLPLVATSDDQRVLTALHFLMNQDGRPHAYPATMSLSFTTEKWRRVVQAHSNGQDVLIRRHLEACVFSALAEELKAGNICVPTSETYGDLAASLVSWETCEPWVESYASSLGLPSDPDAFVTYLQNRLATMAQQVDDSYPTNTQLSIDAQGEPRLRKYQPAEPSDSAKALQTIIRERMPERSILDILHRTACRTNWTRHFGPISGAEPRLERPRQRYILTTFAYGCHLGPTQAARHISGEDITAHMLSYTNRRHIRSALLHAALTDLVNHIHQCDLPRWWGSDKVVATDGTHYRVRKNTLTSEYHIRYGSYGGIAYHHVSANYALLISHFIPCATWEAIYIIEGLQKNQSTIQPDTVHADTQGQSLTVFALCFLWGIKLLPRIRNWKDLIFYRPDAETRSTHIEPLFRGTIDWDIIRTHVRLLWRIVMSIQMGKIAPSLLLQRLNRGSHRHHWYRVLCEVGKVLRTEVLLLFISDSETRATMTATTNKVEAFNQFSQWVRFGDDPVFIPSPDPEEQEKAILYADVVANAVIDQNVVDMTRIVRELIQEGYPVRGEDVASWSPYLTEHINRFGTYAVDGLHEDVVDEEDGQLGFELT